jgi:acetyltransferase-like isoleucine patch superfamily enzyme
MKFISILKSPYTIANALLKSLVTYIPGGFGNRIRYHYYKGKLKSCGTNVTIDLGVIIDGAELISIGNNVYIDKYCIISTGKELVGKIFKKANDSFQYTQGELVIGNNVHIVQFCVLMAYGGIHIKDYCTLSCGTKIYSLSNLPYDPDDKSKIVSIMPYSQAPFVLSPVVLEENVWLGLQCIVMPGTFVGKNSFAASNSLLKDRYSENSYLAGQPAVKTKNRFC